MMTLGINRRVALQAIGRSGLGLVLAPGILAAGTGQKEETEEEVAPAEDLMREHGLLNRILLIYEESGRRLSAPKPDMNIGLLKESAGIIKSFIEEYHEKLEEDHLFPRFKKAGKLIELVDVLDKQHEAGRSVTKRILQLAEDSTVKDVSKREEIVGAIQSFIRMYRPHEAREDTILFPALHDIVSAHEYAAMGEDFEKKEHDLFGEDGFEKMVDKVAGIEKAMGIYDLAQFTPKS
jgi:hemerythrin-like domain-containing protein